MTQSAKRIAWIDIVKFFGIFFVVFGHTFSDEGNFILQVLYLFHVPLFFFISGLTYKYKKDQGQFILDKIKRLYIPYLVASLVSIVVYLLVGSLIGENVSFDLPNILNCLYGMIYANVSAGNMMWNRPLWFLPALLVSLIVMNLLSMIENKTVRAIGIILASALGYVLSAFRIFLPLQAESGLSMLIWIYLGSLLKSKLFGAENWNKIKTCMVIIGLIIAGLAIGFYNGTISVMVDLYGKFVPLYLISALCLIIATCLISILIGHNRVLEYVGRNTLFILLWHKFPIEFFQKVCPGIREMLVSPNLIITDLTTLFVCIFSIVSCLIFQYVYYWTISKLRTVTT